jgi:miniconductance mechanosensitive channel
MVTESFSNWRGMEDSGGRRIMRSIIIDMKSIKFCSDELIEKLSKFELLKEYLDNKKIELEEFNSKLEKDKDVVYNRLRLTNIGTFRKYIEAYLINNQNVNSDMTLIVRQLAPTPEGIPMEIYLFSKVKAWVAFEAIQSDIFDHLLAIIYEFELGVFQNPTGDDFHNLLKR